MSKIPEIVVGVPGKWSDGSAIVTDIAKYSGGYLFAGEVLMQMDTGWSCGAEIYEHDPQLKTAFDVAGGGRIPVNVLDTLKDHTYTFYLIAEGGSIENAQAVMQAANAILKCGGIAVKVESAGVAHSAAKWIELTEDELPTTVMEGFVTYVGGDDYFYSCGMHNIGFPDAVLHADVPPDEAARCLDVFLKYLAFEQPTIHENETFSISADAPAYRLQKSRCEMFEGDDLFHNPFGVWNLKPF